MRVSSRREEQRRRKDERKPLGRRAVFGFLEGEGKVVYTGKTRDAKGKEKRIPRRNVRGSLAFISEREYQ